MGVQNMGVGVYNTPPRFWLKWGAKKLKMGTKICKPCPLVSIKATLLLLPEKSQYVHPIDF